MKCSIALERVRSDIGEDIPQLWRDRELYYYLERGQQRLTNDVQIEEELTTQVTDVNRIGLPQTVSQVIEVVSREKETDPPTIMRQVPITELEYNTEWSIWDNFLRFGDKLTTCKDGLVIQCLMTPSPILDEDGNLISPDRELGYAEGIDGVAYSGFPEKFAMGIVAFAVAQAKLRIGDTNGYAIAMSEFETTIS